MGNNRTNITSFFVAIALAASACTGDRGPAGPQGEPGAPGAMGTAGMTGPAGVAGKNGSDAMVPHLVVAATGEDLGIALGVDGAGSPTGWAIIPGVGRVNYGTSLPEYFASTNCTGASLGFSAGPDTLPTGGLFITWAGDIVKLVGSVTMVQANSEKDWTPGGGSTCAPYGSTNPQRVRQTMATGMKAEPHLLTELDVQLK